MIYSFKTEGTGCGFDFDIELVRDQKIYCFIGKNGIGKTQLLENMAKSLIYSHSIFHPKNEELTYSGYFLNKIINDKLSAQGFYLPKAIKINGERIKGEAQDWGFTKFEYIPSHQSKLFLCQEPIVFIGAKNRGFTKNIDPNNIKILPDASSRFAESLSRTLDYINGNGLEHEEIANWFVSRMIINRAFVMTNQNKENEVITVLQLIDKLEPELELIEKNDNGRLTMKLLFHDGKLFFNNVPFDKLSTGFVSIIKIFQEIVAGYGGWSDLNDLSQVEGIVFIDEIEPHLHISWQAKIIKILRESFPKTTFYLSTHSPVVLAGLKTGEAYELEKEGAVVKAKEIENIENYYLDDMVSKFFDIDLTRQKLDNVDMERQNKAKKMLLDLAGKIDEDAEKRVIF